MRNKNNSTKFFVGMLGLAVALYASFKFFRKKSAKKTATVAVGDAEILHPMTQEVLDLNNINVPSNAHIKLAPIAPDALVKLGEILGGIKGPVPRMFPSESFDQVPKLPADEYDYNILVRNSGYSALEA